MQSADNVRKAMACERNAGPRRGRRSCAPGMEKLAAKHMETVEMD
jgi:hypothetical protein